MIQVLMVRHLCNIGTVEQCTDSRRWCCQMQQEPFENPGVVSVLFYVSAVLPHAGLEDRAARCE